MLSRDDKLHLFVFNTVDGAALILNAILITAIIKRTPDHLQSYSVLLLNTAFVDSITALSSTTVILRLHTLGDEICFGAQCTQEPLQFMADKIRQWWPTGWPFEN
ncbi:hypothetical protein PMAYCL1PPCAC_03927 [Pristionchus mayeri]|uniref:G protein-coupled receptor n=1 Tax=Pristionchus mayeri TaxID=1317129 RepID=A0AAN4Z9F6_9BILA|nr:hypothetical protein PMAYCL1PPCAC_03927 [Pristionchus mayeri]